MKGLQDFLTVVFLASGWGIRGTSAFMVPSSSSSSSSTFRGTTVSSAAEPSSTTSVAISDDASALPKELEETAADTTTQHESASSSTSSRSTWIGELDTELAFSKSTFPIRPDDLLVRAKQVLSPNVGIGTKDGGQCLAENFQFCAAVVGPIGKEEYLNALSTFQLEESFDIEQNAFGFTVSPVQPNRVYWFNHAVATWKAPFFGVDPSASSNNKNQNNKDLIFPPQVFHMDFDEQGQVTEFGFYTVDRQYGNTGGLGGAFGFFYGVGKPLPFPEAKPYKPSFRFRMLQWVGRLARKFGKKKQ